MSTLWPNDCLVFVETMCRNENLHWSSEDKFFKINSKGSYRIARLTLDKHWIFFKLHELKNPQYIFYMITNQLLMYTEALDDVQAYVNAAMASGKYVEPAPTASRSIIYSQLFEELKSPV